MMILEINDNDPKELLEALQVIQDRLSNMYYLYKYGTTNAKEINEIILKDYM